MKARQLAWALAGRIPTDALEVRRGKTSWVLKKKHQRRNLYRREWWNYIAGYEHRWARSLTSSQCFAVNLFAPLKGNADRASQALNTLLPGRNVRPDDEITVAFEHMEKDAAKWLGEKGQPTQIDVYLRIVRGAQCLGHVVVEVKFSERKFGCCRGWSDSIRKPSANGDRAKCLDLTGILKEPTTNCWLARTEDRRYWDLMTAPDSTIRLDASEQKPCPFRRGLYQLMRNRVLADELRRRTDAAWSEFVVCRHPDNQTLLSMKEEIGITNPIQAFRAISAPDAVRDWPADQVLNAIVATGPQLAAWGDWMRRRYFDAI